MATKLAPSRQQLIEDICRDYSWWAPQLSCPPSLGEVLHGGHSHHVQLIESSSQRWVCRIARGDKGDTAQREIEVTIQAEAARRGLAPEVCHSNPELGVTIMEYIDGDHDEPGSLSALAKLLHGIHALPLHGSITCSVDVLRDYRRELHSNSDLATLLARGETLIDAAARCVEKHRASKAVLCHNDLLRANRIKSDDKLYALDWEYAAPGDPFFDLAVCASELSGNDARVLLTHYLRRTPTMDEKQRYQAQSLLYACVEACWFSAYKPRSQEAEHSATRLEQIFSPEAQT
ncbi:choline/ethanolamine kinase family protein [Congregibacter sp.]|uniref:choline/ethanolamine kinase family protein n=1 Tax=Congregibacter sp. TaxID=2744308 RepID=UPI003F6CEC5A